MRRVEASFEQNVDTPGASGVKASKTHGTWRKKSNRELEMQPRDEYRRLQQERGGGVSIEHVRSHTGVRGNEAADALARRGTQIGDLDRIVELRSAEPHHARRRNT